jgi:hypothetical protein
MRVNDPRELLQALRSLSMIRHGEDMDRDRPQTIVLFNYFIPAKLEFAQARTTGVQKGG